MLTAPSTTTSPSDALDWHWTIGPYVPLAVGDTKSLLNDRAKYVAAEPEPEFNQLLAIALLHNVMVRPCFFTSLARLTPVWKTLDDFGAAEATFVPYWEKPVRTSPDCVKTSAWRKPDGTALFVVSNLSPDKTVDAVVELPDGKRTFRLEPFDFRFAEVTGR